MIVEVRIFKPIFLWFSKSKLEREFPELFKTHLTFISTAIFPGVMDNSNMGAFLWDTLYYLRWNTTATRILRLYMSDISDMTTKDKKNLTTIVHYIIGKIRF